MRTTLGNANASLDSLQQLRSDGVIARFVVCNVSQRRFTERPPTLDRGVLVLSSIPLRETSYADPRRLPIVPGGCSANRNHSHVRTVSSLNVWGDDGFSHTLRIIRRANQVAAQRRLIVRRGM